MLNVRSQTQNVICGMISFTWNVKSKKIHGNKKQIAGYLSLGEGEGIGNECLMGIELILRVMKKF